MTTTQPESDEALARRAAQDRGAFRALYERHQRRVAAQVGRLLGPEADVEGVTQEVFVQLFRALGSFRGESRFTTWLYRLTRNVAIDHLRRQPPAVALADLRGLTADQLAWERLTARERLKHLYAALNSLPLAQREAFVLYELEGQTLQEISDLTGESINTVASRVRRAREHLRGLLEQLDERKAPRAEGGRP